MSTAAADNPFAPPTAPLTGNISDAGPFERDCYLLKQKMFAISERYKVFGEGGEELLHVQRPARVLRNLLAAGVAVLGIILAIIIAVALGRAIAGGIGALIALIVGVGLVVGAIGLGVAATPLRHIRFCRDPAYADALLVASQDNRWQLPTARYSLRDAEGTVICRFRKNVLWNLFRRRWYIDDPDGRPLWLVKEDSVLKSILRRIAPDFIAVFMRTNFVFLSPDGLRTVGVFNRKLAIRDHYTLDLGADPKRELDRRIAIAAGVLLDTGEKR
jgi:uncharacterized protein YxjI